MSFANYSLKKRGLLFLGSSIFFLPEIVCAADYSLNNPLSANFVDPNYIIGHTVGVVLQVLGAICLIFFIYAGFLWIFSQGNSDKTETAKKILLWTTVGLALILSSYGILQLIFSRVKTYTGTN